ncbi:MAG: penicillin-binding transpeptidase domain-containing protein [Desulfosarcinaceae bacterium]
MDNYLDSVDSEWFNQRLGRVLIVVLAAFSVMFLRLLYLQVIEGRELRRLSESNSIRLQDIDAPRGLIFDRQGRMLVDNRPAFNLHIVPKDAKPLDVTLEKLSRLMGESVAELKARIQGAKKLGPYKPILLKEDIGRDTLAAIEVHKYDLPGVVVKVSPRRHYLFHEHAVHLIGYMGEINSEELQSEPYADCKAGDYIGKFGVEKVYEGVLRGKRGGRQVEVNANGQIIRVLDTVKAEPGQNIYLTIDHELQATAEHMLEGEAGSVVAVDPGTGEILAMASSPTFDPNLFVAGMSRENWQSLISNPFRPLENKAIQALYPPASTYIS